MRYILMDYVGEAGWPELTTADQEHWSDDPQIQRLIDTAHEYQLENRSRPG